MEVSKLKRLSYLLILLMSILLIGCSKEPHITKTYEVTDSESAFETDELVIMEKYYELSDGTFKTDNYSYSARVEVRGRLDEAECDSIYVYLSNIGSISFEQAWKASGLSSNMDDYFKEEDAKLVAMGLIHDKKED